jgi:hypothetical protein
MNQTEEKRQFNWKNYAVGLIGLILITIIWILHSESIISTNVFYVGSLAVIIAGILVRYFIKKAF